MVFDAGRNRLYVADGATGNVIAVDNATLNTTTSVVREQPGDEFAMTPDGRRLVVLSYLRDHAGCCGSEHGSSRRVDDLPGAECSRREVRTGVRSDYLTRYGDRQLV